MDKLPLFETFEKYVAAAIQQIHSAMKAKKWLTLALYFIVVGIILFSLYWAVRATYNSAYPNKTSVELLLENIYKPPTLTLTYTKEISTKDADNLYHTAFVILIHRPPGNFEEKFHIATRIPYAECSEAEWVGTVSEESAGIASTTATYDVKCTSYKPIVDTKNLFILVGK